MKHETTDGAAPARREPDPGVIRRMPTVFGPHPSPRQPPAHRPPFNSAASPVKRSYYAVFATEAMALHSLIPPPCALRGTPRIVFEYSYLSEVDWLAGRGYNLLAVRVPVTWHGAEVIEGWFQPVVWENLCDPILTGREELGWSKLFADLPAEETNGASIRLRAQWMGYRFFEMDLRSLASSEARPDIGGPLIHHKAMPATGDWGAMDADYFILSPAEGGQARLVLHQQGLASARFESPSWEDMPTQGHIVGALAGIPLQACLAAGHFISVGGKTWRDQRRLAAPPA